MVEERRWCLEHLRQVGVVAALLRAPPQPGDSPGDVACQPGQRGDVCDVVATRHRQQFGCRRVFTYRVLIAFVGSCAGQVHEPGEQIGRGHPVSQCVVHLADERETVVGHALGEMELPQWVAAVQRCARDPADHLVEFASAAGCGHLHAAQVIVEVDRAVFQPHRVVQFPRDVDQPVSQRVEQVQPARDGPSEHVEGELALVVGGIDDRHLQRVGVQIRRLAVQQHRVHAIESLHIPPLRTGPMQPPSAHDLRGFGEPAGAAGWAGRWPRR